MATRVHVDYISPMGDEDWRMSGNRLRCGLSLTVPNFGIAYFEQYAARHPHFILSKWEQSVRQAPASVYVRQPVWKPYGKTFFITKTTVNPGKYGFFLRRDAAIKLLTFLAKGYEAKFHFVSEQGFAVSVSLSPARFQKVYARYQRCLGNLLSFDYKSVRKTIVRFGVDSDDLSQEDKNSLKRIVEYSRADPRIKAISIIGYTDDTGRKSYNNAISEARAKTVKNYLLSLGINDELLSVTWRGILNPIAPNESEAGKAANRRVEVEIEK